MTVTPIDANQRREDRNKFYTALGVLILLFGGPLIVVWAALMVRLFIYVAGF